MTRLCPKPCSRLATAAIFMIIGVVQLLAGVILLRSKYADLLSGPDFMTGSSNLAFGCIYGTISSIWKINNKKKSAKITARKNVLATLLLSVITVNATSAIILIMGDGNRLLNLHLENNKQKTIDFTSEILAYAYISSVFSPIFCIVVALVIISGRCIEICRDVSTEKAKNSVANDDCYNWVFDPKVNGKVICDTVETSSESTSASEDSVFTEEDNSYSRRTSIKNIPNPLNMWKEKRERILNDANRSHKQPRLDREKPNFYDCSHERLIPRIKESSLRRDLNPKLGDLGEKSSKTFKSILKRSSSSPVSRETGFHASNPTNDSIQTRCRYDCGQANDYENRENRFPEHLRARKATSSNRNKANKLTRTNGQSLNRTEPAEWEEIHFIDPIISELKAETLKELKQKVAKILPGASIAVIKLPETYENQECMSLSEGSDEPLRNAAHLSEKPHCSDVSRYKLFTNCSESSSSAGKQLLSDKTPDSYHQSSYSSENSPYAQSAYKNKGTKTGFSAISKIRSKSFDYLNEEEAFPNKDESKFSSLMIVDEKKSFPLDSQRVSSSKQQNKKIDTSRKMSMASIAEIPSEEDYYSERDSVCSTSDFGDHSQMTDENSNIRVNMSPSSRHIPSTKASRRKSSLTSNKLLKRMWSSSEPKINVSDLIVDKDSLIGLSEEELLARTLRIRSLRKTVEDRLKKKKEAEKATNTYSSDLVEN